MLLVVRFACASALARGGTKVALPDASFSNLIFSLPAPVPAHRGASAKSGDEPPAVMRGAGGRGSSHGGAIVLLFLVGLAVRSDGRQMRLAELSHTPRNIGANEWWDAVTGADEYGDVVTTFMHKVGPACTTLSVQHRECCPAWSLV